MTQSLSNDKKNIRLELKEEQLDLTKSLVQTGDVKAYKETFIEERNFTIPIYREELVVEKKVSDESASEYKDKYVEVIRIPLSREEVEFTKHRIPLEDVSLYKEKLEDIKHIDETLRKEELKLETSGSPEVTYEFDKKDS